jgi:hypothetical protein
VDLTFSSHAQKRMVERRISLSDIEAILVAPARTDVKEFELVYDGAVNGRPLRVVVALGTDPPHVVSVYPRRR